MKKQRLRKELLSIVLTAALVLTVIPLDIFTLETRAASEEVTKAYSLDTATIGDDRLTMAATDPDDSIVKPIILANGSGIQSSNQQCDISSFSGNKNLSNLTGLDGAGQDIEFTIFPNINGKVTKIEFTKARRGNVESNDSFSMSISGMKYNGTDNELTGVDAWYTSNSITFVSTDSSGVEGNLSIILGPLSTLTFTSGCEMRITYIPGAAPVHVHSYSFNVTGNELTATCVNNDGLDCSLADSDHKATFTLTADGGYYGEHVFYGANHNCASFNAKTGLNATVDDIVYTNKSTGETSTSPVSAVGSYTATLVVHINGTDYTLTKDFVVRSDSHINNIYPQLNISTTDFPEINHAREGETVTLTFTPQNGETLKSLSVKGETTNYSLGNGITKVDDTHYTFSMPAETVTIDASFTCNISIDNTIQHGSVTASVGTTENATTATNGDTVILNVTPDEGYELESLVVKLGDTDTAVTVSGEGNSRYFTMPASNVTVAATWKKLQTNSDIFSGHSLLLTGQIGVEFLITLPEGMGAQGCYMTFSGNQIDGNYRATGQAIGNNRYQYIVYIPAYQMADKITPTFHYFENEVEKTTVGEAYSAEDYIKWGLTNLTDERELNVIRALADYGYYSQIYLSGFNNWTIGTDYAEMKTRYSTSFNYNTVRTELASYAVNSDIADLSYRLNFGSTTRLDIRFTANGGETVELDGVEKTPDTDGNYSLVSVSGIPASQLTTGHTLKVGGKTATISPMSYAYTLLGRTNESNELKNLLCAFYNYGNACAAYNQN